MRVVLANQPLLSEGHDPTLAASLQSRELNAPPLGTLVAAALFREAGCHVSLADLNHLYLNRGPSRADSAIHEVGAGHLAQQPADLFGFSTICSSYHSTLLLARELKRLRAETPILLGGPQASASGLATLEACHWVDFVLCGEVEETIEPFVESAATAPHKVPGLVYRTAQGEIRANPTLPPPAMSLVPLPAYDLWIKPHFSTLLLEAGRGCPCNCKFCSTNSFFGRSYRIKEASQLLQEARDLIEQHQCQRAVLVHDHLGARPEHLQQLCLAWGNDPLLSGVPWTCSIRADTVTVDVANALKQGQCDGVFIGVETGSQRMQTVINKRLNLERVAQALGHLAAVGLEHNVSFIAGYPEESRQELGETFEMYGRQLFSPLATPQIATLSPIAGSGYFQQFEEQLVFRPTPSDIGSKGDRIPPDVMKWMSTNKQLFAARYSLPEGKVSQQFVTVATQFLKYSTALFRWVLASGVRCAGSLSTVIDLWLRHNGDQIEADHRGWYEGGGFRNMFLAFMKQLPELCEAGEDEAAQHQALVLAHTIPEHLLTQLREQSVVAVDELEQQPQSIPVLAPRCAAIALNYRYTQIVSAMCRGIPATEVARTPSSVLVATRGLRVILQEPSLLTSQLLRAFTGGRRFDDAIASFQTQLASLLPAGIALEDGCEVAVQKLLDDGLLGIVQSSQSHTKSKP